LRPKPATKWEPIGSASSFQWSGTDIDGMPAMFERAVNGMKPKTAVR